MDWRLEMGFGSMGGSSVDQGWWWHGSWLGFLFMVVSLVTEFLHICWWLGSLFNGGGGFCVNGGEFLCICWWLGSLFNGGGGFCVNGGGWVFCLMMVVGFLV